MASVTGYLAGHGQVRLTLDLTPNSTLTGGDILAVAVLTTERNPAPIPNLGIAFFRGSNEEGRDDTNEAGRAERNFSGLGFGTHSISAQVAGIHITQRHTFKEEKPKSPTAIDLTPIGDKGHYTLLIAVRAEAVGVGGIPIAVFDDNGPISDSRGIDVIADKYGQFLFNVPAFTEEEKNVTVVAAGITRCTKLFGPR